MYWLLIAANRHICAASVQLEVFAHMVALDLMMDVKSSRRLSVALQVEESTADDEILINDRHRGSVAVKLAGWR